MRPRLWNGKGSRMRKVIFLIALVALVSAAVAEGPLFSRNRQREMSVKVDSVMWRSDVTRVYCRLFGLPHTSQRVDAVTLDTPDASVAATDIDPLYFKRSFQWEDNGVIEIELDFAPVKPVDEFTMTFVTPYGDVAATYSGK